MHCYYHTKREAMLRCSACGKEICKNCFSLFKSHRCLDCEKETTIKALMKSLATLIISTTVAVGACFVFKNLNSIKNEFIYDGANLIYEFFGVIVYLLEYIGIEMSETVKHSLIVTVSIYFLSSVPWGYYALSKASNKTFSGSILVILILLYIKILLSCLVGPIAMPIGFIILVKNIAHSFAISKMEKKMFAEIIKETPELEVNRYE